MWHSQLKIEKKIFCTQLLYLSLALSGAYSQRANNVVVNHHVLRQLNSIKVRLEPQFKILQIVVYERPKFSWAARD